MNPLPLPPLDYSFSTFPSITDLQQDTCDLENAQIHDSSYWNHLFPNFVFEKEIALTDNSIVWQGLQRSTKREVALKITHKFQAESSQKIHQNKQNEFVGEHKLNCMAEILGMQVGGQYRLMVMKHYAWNLAQISSIFTEVKHRRYTQNHLKFVVYAFTSILKAVQELHQIGFLHRDLKPDNMLVDSEFKIVLTDFGLVTKEGQIDTSSSGTLEYLAPERLSKKRRQNPIKKSVDVWSLGIILYELFTGENPFNGETQDQLLSSICDGYIKNKQIPNNAMDLINSILQLKTQNRPTIAQIKKHSFLQGEASQIHINEIINQYL